MKQEINYKEIIEGAVRHAKLESEKKEVEAIGTVITNNGKRYEPISRGLFGKGAILIKRKNRKFIKAIEEYCKENTIFCSYSEYHKAMYVGFCKSDEYERKLSFYQTMIYYFIGSGIDEKLLSHCIELD